MFFKIICILHYDISLHLQYFKIRETQYSEFSKWFKHSESETAEKGSRMKQNYRQSKMINNISSAIFFAQK